MAALIFVLPTISIILLVIYFALTWRLDYWKKRNVPFLQPKLLFGNYEEYIKLKKTSAEVAREICRQFPNEPYIGTYFGTEPAILVQDPELIKLILAKDYSFFCAREIAKHVDKEPCTNNMFFANGDKWKVARQNFSPLFSSSKLKKMFPLIQKCTRKFEDLLEFETNMSHTVEIRSMMSRFTMECVCSIAFGIDVNVLGKNAENNQFAKIGQLVFEASTMRGIAIYVRNMWPSIFYGLGLRRFPQKITNFFEKLIGDVFASRGHKPSARNDFIDLLLDMKQQDYLTCESILPSTKGQKVSVKVDDELLIAQCTLIFAGGYETSATTSGVVLYQLAKDQEAQKRVVHEINKYLQKREGSIEFDCVTELPYLDACINESMRLNPIIGLLTREVMDTYTLLTGLVLEKGLRVHIPVYHLHKNPAYFPDPEIFKPERFLDGNKDKIIPFTYMPFGEGQRLCVGRRLAKMQIIPGLITVLRNYRLELPEDMAKNTAYEFEPCLGLMAPKHGFPIKFLPRKE